MTISYPLSLPAASIVRMNFRPDPRIGSTESPFSGSQQTFVWPNDRWLLSITWPPLIRNDADDVESFLLALNGREGSFLAGDLSRPSVRGTWLGQSPLVNGASQTGRSLIIDGLTPTTTTGIAGDYFQLGSGSTSRLYRLTKNFTANGSGQATLDIWPRLRASPADNAPLVLASPVGLFMLAGSIQGWAIEGGLDAEITIDCAEDLRGV